MTPNDSQPQSVIRQAVQSVWTDAGYDAPTAGIVPLFELVASYPIWVAEVENLSISRAIHYLAERTGQTPEMGLAGDGPLSGFLYVFCKRKRAHFNDENEPTWGYDTLKIISNLSPF